MSTAIRGERMRSLFERVRAEQEEDEASGSADKPERARTWRTRGFFGCRGYRGALVARSGACAQSSDRNCA